MSPLKQVQAYQKTGAYSGVMYAEPHALITQMLDGALMRIAEAGGAIERKEISRKAEAISKAVLIVGALEGCLDHEQGGEIASNLSRLYEYMNISLAQANINNDIDKLDEVSNLLLEIKSAWIQIPAQQHKESA